MGSTEKEESWTSKQNKSKKKKGNSTEGETMLRTLKNLFKQDREKFVVPKSVQNVIPIKTIWEDGIFLVGRNKVRKRPFKFERI